MIYVIHISLVSFVYSVIYLFVTLGLSGFVFIPSYRRRPEEVFKWLGVFVIPVIAVLRYLQFSWFS